MLAQLRGETNGPSINWEGLPARAIESSPRAARPVKTENGRLHVLEKNNVCVIKSMKSWVFEIGNHAEKMKLWVQELTESRSLGPASTAVGGSSVLGRLLAMMLPEIAIAEGTGSGNGETKVIGGESSRVSPK